MTPEEQAALYRDQLEHLLQLVTDTGETLAGDAAQVAKHRKRVPPDDLYNLVQSAGRLGAQMVEAAKRGRKILDEP